MRITFPGGAVAEGSVQDCVEALKRWGRETPAPKAPAPASPRKKYKAQRKYKKYMCPVCGERCSGAIGLGLHKARWCKGAPTAAFDEVSITG